MKLVKCKSITSSNLWINIDRIDVIEQCGPEYTLVYGITLVKIDEENFNILMNAIRTGAMEEE